MATEVTTVNGPTVVVHDYAKEPRYNIVPLVDGSMSVQLLGYVSRRDVFILWAKVSDVLSYMAANEGGSRGFYRDGEIQYTPIINESFGLYNARLSMVKFTSS